MTAPTRGDVDLSLRHHRYRHLNISHYLPPEATPARREKKAIDIDFIVLETLKTWLQSRGLEGSGLEVAEDFRL